MTEAKTANFVWHHATLHASAVKHKMATSPVLWFTDLSGAGKSTLADAVEKKL